MLYAISRMFFINFLCFNPNYATFLAWKLNSTRCCNKQRHNTTQYEAISAIKYQHSIGQIFSTFFIRVTVQKTFFTAVKLSFACSLLILLAGCQKPSEPQPVKEQMESAQPQNEAADLTLLCKKVEQHMLEINSQRTTFALEQINQDLKVCLPLMPLAKQLQLLQRSNEMYKNFLLVDRTAAQQLAFEQYAFDMAQHPTIHQSHFEQLHIRDQYLLKHQGQAYVELADASFSSVHYRREPDYLAKVFAPNMPEAERVFIENLALQNVEPAFANQALLIEPFEIARRALFWEGYVKTYPKSSFIVDAQHLLYEYKVFLFKGLKNSPVSSNYADSFDIQVSSLEEIKKLSKLKQSELAVQSGKFLQYLEMSNDQRRQSVEGQANLSAWQQIERYLNLHDPKPNYKKDCFSDSVCL